MSYQIKYQSQSGAALLIVMLVLISASSYALVSKLNSASQLYTRQQQSSDALAEAKQALISYATTYPDRVNSSFGPGYLPCPDRDNDGSTDAGACASSSNTTIGRLPWVTLRLNDLRDSSGQRLWYVLSDNYRNNPKLEPLNSETAGQLSFDIDADGDIDASDVDDIVAIIIAPGEPIVTGAGVTQSRDPSQTVIVDEIAQYLEGDNTDFDTNFVNASTANVNDRLVYITRNELMQQVEKRVLGEANQILSNYFTAYGAYPWLSPFADPKTTKKYLSGEHSGADNQTNLTDASVDFTQWGVANGDTVWNITDGSHGIITAVTATTLTVGGGLSLGADNDFDTDDEYFVDTETFPTSFIGTSAATAGSSGLTLEDTTRDFDNLGVRVGDIVDNNSTGQSGIIESIDNDELTVSSGTGVTFNNGDLYRIRTSMGRATFGSSSLTLVDARVDFVAMGIQEGDVIRNITDGSYGRVASVTDTPSNRLTVTELLFGTNNTFSQDDYYILPRFNSSPNTSEGLLSFHETGESFKTALDFDWVITVNAGDITVNNSTILQNYISNYSNFGAESFSESRGTCIWLSAGIADCFGYFKDFVNISGFDTSSWNSTSIRDSTATFITDGVKRGDIAQNYDDEVSVTSGTVDAGNSGTATTNTDANGNTLEDTNNNFGNIPIAVGDTIYNITDDSSGTITGITANQITVGDGLIGGTNNVFAAGDSYQIGEEPILYDASADFSIYERYSYVIQNNTLEGELGEWKIQGVISDILIDDTLEAEAYVGEGTEPIQFRPGDSYQIYQPRRFFIETINSETRVTTDNYTSNTNPDFDQNEYYRIMPAGNSQTANLDTAFNFSGTDILIDASADFVNDGVEVGDIVENHAGAYGEITFVSSTVIFTTLYGGTSQQFVNGNSYTVYYDYVFSREHVLHARFAGNSNTKVVSEERKRDMCLGYANCTATISGIATDDSTGFILEDDTTNFISAGIIIGNYVKNITEGSVGQITNVTATTLEVASLNGRNNRDFEEGDIYEILIPNSVGFSGNGNVPFITVTDYQEDETTNVGSATFTPTASNGSIRINDIDFYLNEEANDFPAWFVNNDWHKLTYVAVSPGDEPGAAINCSAGSNCLTANIVKSGATTANDDINALVIAAGSATGAKLDSTCLVALAAEQDRTNGTINEYFELENCDVADNTFQKQAEADDYNDQILILATTP